MRACGKRPVYSALIAGLVSAGALAVTAGSASAGQGAQITVFAYQAGAPAINLGVDIPKSVDMQARTGKKAWGIDLTVTYVDQNNVVQTIDSGPLDIATQTQFLNSVDGNTDFIQAPVNFGATPQPGVGATFTGTATLIKP
jgi:hypothetical protein